MEPDVDDLQLGGDLPKPIDPVAKPTDPVANTPPPAPNEDKPSAAPSTDSSSLPRPITVVDQSGTVSTSSSSAPGATPVAAPTKAGDLDLIEKEWVEKAKAIVDHTRDDPHRQNKEISKFKADYLKSRYNKQLKDSEE